MARRVIGFLLILKALSPFIWLVAAVLVAMSIADRFGEVSGGYSTRIDIQLEAYDELARRIGEQVDAIEPTVDAAVAAAMRDFAALQAHVDGTIARLRALPPIDLSNVVPELRLPPIRLFRVSINWAVPDVPLVREVLGGIRNVVQGLADGINTAFSSFASAIGDAFASAVAPLRHQLVANVMAQLQPYLDAYARVQLSMEFARDYYDSLLASLDRIQLQLDAAADIWQRIGDDLGDQLGLSISLVETVPENLDSAIAHAVFLLLAFAVFSLALFLVFYWAGMLRDLLQGWMLMMGRYEDWKRQRAEPGRPALERWLEKYDRRSAVEPV